MERTPEPELMSTPEQARAYAEADFEESHGNVIQRLRERLPDLPEIGTALDLGCGPADISIRFARAFPLWKVHGVDGSPAMLTLGRETVSRAGLEGRIELVEAILPDYPAPVEAYDLVFSNSVLHHLADPATLWESVRRYAKPDGWVFVVDLMRPNSEEQVQEFGASFADEPDVLRRDYRNSLRAAYRLEEIAQQLRDNGMSQLRTATASDRHLMVWGRIPQGAGNG